MSSARPPMVTLIVPTLNRPDFMLRTLRYYAAAGIDGKILIGDSSAPEYASRIRSYLQSGGALLHATHVECPGLDGPATLLKLEALVDTPYVVFIGDDDVVLPHGIAACIEVLE